MSFEIQVTRRPGPDGNAPTVVRLSGVLDIVSSREAEKALTPLVATGPKVVVFDLGELRFVDSTGISIFLSTRRSIEAKGGKMFTTNMQPQIRKVFDIVKALPGSAVFETMREMDDYLKDIQEKAEEEGE